MWEQLSVSKDFAYVPGLREWCQQENIYHIIVFDRPLQFLWQEVLAYMRKSKCFAIVIISSCSVWIGPGIRADQHCHSATPKPSILAGSNCPLNLSPPRCCPVFPSCSLQILRFFHLKCWKNCWVVSFQCE